MARTTECTVTSGLLEYEMQMAADGGSLRIKRHDKYIWIEKEDWDAIKEAADLLLYRGDLEGKGNG